jgi:Cobalamin-5-phosphate synthase
MSILKAFKAGFGFLSVIPVGITMEGIEALMKNLYMYSIVGFILGAIIGIAAFVAEFTLAPLSAAIIVMLVTYGIIWFNHLDGVADMGDGMTAHGSLEKKRKALKDMSLGVGGVAFVSLLLLSFYAALTALEMTAGGIYETGTLPYMGAAAYILSAAAAAGISTAVGKALITAALIALTVTVGETCGKQAMLTIATFGKSFQEGLGSMTIEGGTRRNFLIGILFTAIVSGLLLGIAGWAAVIVSTAAAFIILKISNRHFKGLNGDGIGMANEVGRITAIASVALILHIISGGMAWML